MWLVINFDDGMLGKVFVENDFDKAVACACKCYEETTGEETTEAIQEELETYAQLTRESWGIYLGQPELDR